jgi:hypothetical protein
MDNLREESPVLIIGLGGTGKETLLRLRRMFYDYYGTPTLPHIATLRLDTDTRDASVDGKKLPDHLMDVNFAEVDRLDVALKGLNSYYEKKEYHPHIFSWFDSALEKHGDIKDGAAQIRSFGRLAFFHHYKVIRDKINKAFDRITGQQASQEAADKYNIKVRSGDLRVWLVFSVAGGTGSGLFLDMAFLIREMFRDKREVKINSLLALPSVFTTNTNSNLYANAYAALKELEHYNYGGRQTGDAGQEHFRVLWTRDLMEQGISLPPPVFDTTYLIDAQTEKGARIDKQGDLFEMAAETLFLMYGNRATTWASAWNSRRSNDEGVLTETCTVSPDVKGRGYDGGYEQVFSRRYGSFGLAKIYMPVRRLAVKAQYQISVDILDFMLRHNPTPSTFDQQVQRDYGDRLPFIAGASKRPTDVIRRFTAHGSSSMKQELSEQYDKRLEEELSKGIFDQAEILEWHRNGVLELLLDGSNPDPSRRGRMYKLLFRDRKAEFIQSMKAEIEEVIAEDLHTVGKRFNYVEELLREINERCRALSKKLESDAQKERKAQRRLDDKIKTLGSWLADTSGNTQKVVARTLFDTMKSRAEKELIQHVNTAASEALDELSKIVGTKGETEKDARGDLIETRSGLLKKLTDLRTELERMRDEISERLKHVAVSDLSTINRELEPGEEAQRVFQAPDGSNLRGEEQIRILEKKFFEVGSTAGENIWTASEKLGGAQTDRFLGDLLDFVHQQLGIDNLESVNAVEKFDLSIDRTDSNYSRYVGELLVKGSPWLADSRTAVDEWQSDLVYDRFLSFSKLSDEAAQMRLLDVVRKNESGVEEIDGPPDVIYATSAKIGIPLMAIPGLQAYRDTAYYPRLDGRGDRSPHILHTELDPSKFQDLLPHSEIDAKNRVDALKLLVLGIMLRVVEPEFDEDSTSARWSFDEAQFYYSKRRDLGHFNGAVRLVAKPDDLRASLDKSIEARLTDATPEEREQLVVLARIMLDKPPVAEPGLSTALEIIRQDMTRKADGAASEVEERQLQLAKKVTEFAEETRIGSGFWRLKAAEADALSEFRD